MNIKRVFLIVLDSLGIGELPDADKYGDKGSNTLKAIYQSDKFNAENLKQLGLFNINGVDFAENFVSPLGTYGRFREASAGKDTTIGHWEISGLISQNPLPTYPNGFDDEIISEFEKHIGRKILCNKPYSGTKVIADYGEEHIKTGKPIVYTSADSVFQIAAHEDVIPLETLYDYCRTARRMLVGKHGVGRVIARPFVGENGNFTRTANRHDFSLVPPKPTLLNVLADNGFDTVAVGKISDIFAGSGVSEKITTKGNSDGMAKTMDLLQKKFTGLCFVNLVDFDMLYGHRNDVDGYANAVAEFDLWLKDFTRNMNDDDILMITSDHGCDPSTPSTDHSREYTFLLMYGKAVQPHNLGTRESFADIGKTIADMFAVKNNLDGKSFLNEVV